MSDLKSKAASHIPAPLDPSGTHNSSSVKGRSVTFSETKRILEITFHSAHNIPVGDLHNLSCDPYIDAELVVPQDPKERDDLNVPLTFRTPTVRTSRDPVWTKVPPSSLSAIQKSTPQSEPSGKGKEASNQPSNGVAKEDGSPANRHLPSICQWLVGGISANTVELVMHFKDEDPGSHDDSLGEARATFNLDEHDGLWREERYRIKKRKSALKVYVQTYLAYLNPRRRLDKHAYVVVSCRVVGEDEQTSIRPYTLGPNKWSQHFSPIIGLVAPARHAKREDPTNPDSKASSTISLNLSSSKFVANKIQLTGPVPPELHQHFVGFSNAIIALFTSKGLKGMILNQAMHKQYRTLYSYDKATKYGVVGIGYGGKGLADEERAGEDGGGEQGRGESKSDAFAKQFLRMTSYGEGGRVFTYVFTLDGEWRFTETGEEFAIDMISKHTMHGNVSLDVLWSGEFFVRRKVDEEGGGFATGIQVERGTIGSEDPDASKENQEIQDKDKEGKDKKGDDHADPVEPEDDLPLDPHLYELVIDNDSGTYRPDKKDLPILRSWLDHPDRLGGLGRITAVDGFDEGLVKAKKHRAEVRKSGKGLLPEDEAGGQSSNVVKRKVQQVEQKVAALVGKDLSKKADPTGPGRQVMAKKGSDSSLSSIGSGVLGRGRSGSISSTEIAQVVAQKRADADQEEA